MEKSDTVAHKPKKRRKASDQALEQILKKSKSDSSESILGWTWKKYFHTQNNGWFFRSQQSKGSEASVIIEDREQKNLDSLLNCVKEIATDKPTMKIKKPLGRNPKQKQKKNVAKAAAEIVHVVCKTLHPKGTKEEISRLAEDSLKELKSVVNNTENSLSETLQSIVNHYQNCDRKVIKRALLAEIVKQLKFPVVQKLVDDSITLYE